MGLPMDGRGAGLVAALMIRYVLFTRQDADDYCRRDI